MNRPRFKALIEQAFRFGLVGVLNTLLDLGVFTLLALIPFFAQYYTLTKAISYTCGLVNSLIMNRRFTFRDKEKMTAKRLFSFLGVNAVSWSLSVAIIALLTPTGLSVSVRNVIASCLALAVSFVGNKLLVFRG